MMKELLMQELLIQILCLELTLHPSFCMCQASRQLTPQDTEFTMSQFPEAETQDCFFALGASVQL